MCLLHKTVNKRSLAMVQVSHQSNIPDQVGIVHQVSQELCVVACSGQLLLNMLELVLLHRL
jgi:hypothetical protein